MKARRSWHVAGPPCRRAVARVGSYSRCSNRLRNFFGVGLVGLSRGDSGKPSLLAVLVCYLAAVALIAWVQLATWEHIAAGVACIATLAALMFGGLFLSL